LLWPTTDIVCPDWTVQVRETNGEPIEGAEVTASSQQYTLESRDVEQRKISGKDGTVHFDARRIRAIGLVRVLGAIVNIGSQGAHAGFGIHTSVYAYKRGFGDPSDLRLFTANDKNSTASGEPTQSSQLILMKCPPGYSGFGCDFPDDPSQPIKPLNLGPEQHK
jgi:hypothetical protein